MVIKCINLDKSKRLWIIVIFAVITAIFLILFSFIHIYSKKNSSKSTKDFELSNIQSYSAKYEMTVISNKNKNEYLVNEWYQNKDGNVKYRFDFNIKDSLSMSYIMSDNILKITGKDQLNILNITGYDTINTNLISISTFIELYKNVINNSLTKGFKMETKNIDNNTEYTILFDKSKYEESDINKKYRIFFRVGLNISKIKLIVDNKNTPLEYFVLSENDETIIYVKYLEFNIKNNFDQKIFAN